MVSVGVFKKLDVNPSAPDRRIVADGERHPALNIVDVRPVRELVSARPAQYQGCGGAAAGAPFLLSGSSTRLTGLVCSRINQKMKTRDSPPPPVHVHVPETTPVHVHMRRSPCRTPQIKAKDIQVRGDGGRPKVRTPWIPPGILSCRRDVGSLKCQRSRIEHRSGSGIGHQWDEEGQEEELAGVSKNLTVLLREQDSIRQLKKSDSRSQHRETDELLRALIEAEIDGVAVANQLTALKDTIDSLAKDKRLSKLHESSLARQQDLLLEKIEMFDHTNHSLRELLRDWSEYERESLEWIQQKDAIKKRLTASEAENIRLLTKLTNKENEASKLAEHLNFEKENVKQTEELSRILRSTHGHLESELSRAEAEKIHLDAQVQEELHTLQGELQTLRQRRDEEQEEQERQDQEELTLLTQKAERAEENTRQLAEKVQEKVGIRAEEEEFREQLHHLSAENTSINVDNQRLKEKLGALQSEARRMKSSIKKQEQLVEKYKKKVQQVRLESEESLLKLETTQREAREVKLSLERGTEQVRRGLLGRLREMEALPDRLRRAEQQLRDAQQEAEDHQRRNVEHNSALSEVRHKVEQQGTQLEMLQQRNLLLQEDNNVLKEKTHNFERRLEDLTVENQEMSEALPSKEASLRSVQQQLEEKSHEVSFLSRQLQTTLDDAQRQRASQSKALDLQSQLSRAKTEQSQLQRSKEEMERRFQSQLQNMKDRLEQSDSTNRSLQNYVHFLKTSYGNVFSDSLLAS
ncbi:hypothetical protein F7725_013219 [Dissostichus mawsoni]|uniref:Outer dense fiber protein 2 n=1 Tax=Dissostichus mawsoni TaxID=36200 RepID=A0A7J5YSQ6_DISMA|nr:hypothetical protein F7725_013219 [Dissostichus mawsoni]